MAYSGKQHFSGDHVIRQLWTYMVRFIVDTGYWSVYKALRKTGGVDTYNISQDLTITALDEWLDLETTDAYNESVEGMEEGVDYEIDRPLGRIKFLSSGSATQGSTVHIDYEWHREGLVFYSNGISGEEHIFVGMRPYIDDNGVNGHIFLKAYTYFQEEMDFADTSLGEPTNKLTFELWSSDTDLWLFVNPQRIIGVGCIQGYYNCFYLGFFNRFALPHEYPYPLCVISSDIDGYSYASTDDDRQFLINSHNIAFVVENNTWVSKYDSGNPGWLLPHQRSTDYRPMIHYPEGKKRVLFPVYIYKDGNLYGQLDGVYGAYGAITSSESEITIGGDTYICFENVFRHGWGDFMAIKCA